MSRGQKIFTATFSIILLVVVCAYLFWFRALEFERYYLENTGPAFDIRKLADMRGIHLGASTDELTELNSTAYKNTFNSYTPTNALKMGALLKKPGSESYDFTASDSLISAAKDKQLRVRGHTLVWGRLSDDYGDPDLQTWLDQHADKAVREEKLQALMYQHIEHVLAHYKGMISQWDVVNEPLALFGEGELDENIYTRYVGVDYVEKALGYAHKVDPTAKLYINEQLHNYSGKKAQAFLKFIAGLLENGVPLHGVGLQHHMLFHLESVESTRAYIKRLEQLGVEVEITELDARLRLFKGYDDPYEAQGEYYGALLDMCLELTACKGVTFWGLSDKQAWHDEMGWMFPKPNEPYLFDVQNREKPGIRYIQKALQN